MSEIRVIVASAEEAYDGTAEFWCGGELMGVTMLSPSGPPGLLSVAAQTPGSAPATRSGMAGWEASTRPTFRRGHGRARRSRRSSSSSALTGMSIGCPATPNIVTTNAVSASERCCRRDSG
jgi:hypothetical protein